MTHAPHHARPPRPFAEYRWTPPKALAFIEALATHGKVAAAARAVGMTRQSAYRLKQRVPAMSEAWARARAIGQARRRAGPKNVRRQATHGAPQGDTFGEAK